jgi:hypothetical protein
MNSSLVVCTAVDGQVNMKGVVGEPSIPSTQEQSCPVATQLQLQHLQLLNIDYCRDTRSSSESDGQRPLCRDDDSKMALFMLSIATAFKQA